MTLKQSLLEIIFKQFDIGWKLSMDIEFEECNLVVGAEGGFVGDGDLGEGFFLLRGILFD